MISIRILRTETEKDKEIKIKIKSDIFVEEFNLKKKKK